MTPKKSATATSFAFPPDSAIRSRIRLSQGFRVVSAGGMTGEIRGKIQWTKRKVKVTPRAAKTPISARTLNLLSKSIRNPPICLLYTSDAADDLLCVDLGGRRIIK